MIVTFQKKKENDLCKKIVMQKKDSRQLCKKNTSDTSDLNNIISNAHLLQSIVNVIFAS